MCHFKKSLFALCFLALAVIGCEQKEEMPPEDPAKDAATPIEVVNGNSGFSHIYDHVELLSSATGASPSMGVADFTLEANQHFNLVYYTVEPLQQSDMYTYSRVTKNLQTGELVPLPQYADNLKTFSRNAIKQASRMLVLEQFRPYSNFYTYATTSRQQFSNAVYYGGDAVVELQHGNPIGTPDLGFYYPAMNMETVNLDNNGFGHFTLGVPNPTYLLSVCNPISYTLRNRSTKVIIKGLLEPRYPAQGNSMALLVRADSLFAYQVEMGNPQNQVLKDRLAVFGFTPTNNVTTMRHYSLDGKKMALLLKDEVTKKYWTFTYNFTTQKLASGFNGASLDFSATGSDIDIDEEGNIYYTGVAGKGTNTQGVSVYRKNSIDGTTTLVGADHFLKFGEIVKLKVLHGKVYLAVRGRKSGSNYFQLSILQQK